MKGGGPFGKKLSTTKKDFMKESIGVIRTLSEPVHNSEQTYDLCKDGLSVANLVADERNEEEKENWDLDEITCNSSNILLEQTTGEVSSVDGEIHIHCKGGVEWGGEGHPTLCTVMIEVPLASTLDFSMIVIMLHAFALLFHYQCCFVVLLACICCDTCTCTSYNSIHVHCKCITARFHDCVC